MATDRDPSRIQQSYIGDGVYVANDGYQIWVRANNADWYAPGAANLALEPKTLISLLAYARIVGLLSSEPI